VQETKRNAIKVTQINDRQLLIGAKSAGAEWLNGEGNTGSMDRVLGFLRSHRSALWSDDLLSPKNTLIVNPEEIGAQICLYTRLFYYPDLFFQ
jgi:hypothetical protein